MERAPGQRRRRIGRIAAAVVGGLALIMTLLPLALRGPVARWAVSRATASVCGTFRISGGHFGWAAVWELLAGRPVALVVEGSRIVGPDGQVVFAAERFEATLEIHTSPFRLVLSDVLMARGRWRLALLPDEVTTADAFRAVPDEGREACLSAAPPKRAKPGKTGGSLVLRNIRFQDVDVDLAFDGWELELARANANGQLSAGGEGPPLLFEARDVVATSGALRLGRRGNAWTARVPFDAVEIARVGVTPELPTDLELQVASARTGRARLFGHAAFRNIFPPRIGQRPPGEPGLDVDARWTGFGAALAGLDATWRPQGLWASHMDGDLHASVKGPFQEMAGMLEIEGDGTRVLARVAHGAADLALTFAGVETGWMVDPALRPLLGGALHGHFHATAHLWPTFAGIDAEIPDADLRLDRRRAPSGPRHFQLRIGKGSSGAEGATDTLYASVESVRLNDAVLRLQGLRADWTGLSARLDAHVAFAPPGSVVAAPPGHRPRSELEAHGQLAVAALEDWIPGGAVSGPLHLAARAEGTIAHVALGLAFAPPTVIGVYGQRFLLPRKLDVLFAAETGLSVPKFQLRRVGGGTIELGGRLGGGGKVAASLAVRDYPVDAIPGLDRERKLGELTGTLHAGLVLGGLLARPSLHGQIGVVRLAMGRRPVGDVETNLRLGSDGGDLDATIDPGITLHARVRRRPALSFDGTVAVRDRTLGPWLPPPLAGAPITASGDVKIGYRAAGFAGAGLLHLTGPGLAGAQIDGEVQGLEARARLQGEIDISRWPQLWSRALKSAAGALAVDLTVVPVLAPPAGPPHFSGSLRVARPLTLQSAHWPAPISVPAGGRMDLDGDLLTVRALSVVTPGLRGGVAGRATLDLEDPARTQLALTLAAELDAARFPVRLPSGVVVSGAAAVDARIGGTLGGAPGPTLDGAARLDNLRVQLSAATPAARANGRVEAHGDHLRTDGLRVDIAGVGAVTIGTAGTPATAEVASLSPFRLGRVDVPFGGQDLRIGQPSSQLYLPDLDANLRLSGDGRGDLKIAGEVAMVGGSYDPSRDRDEGKKKKASGKPRVSGPWYQALPAHLTLDLDLRGSNKGMRVAVPVFPDVTVDFQCHLHASSHAATWTGQLRGNTTYARAAVAVADWFTDSDIRGCQLTK